MTIREDIKSAATVSALRTKKKKKIRTAGMVEDAVKFILGDDNPFQPKKRRRDRNKQLEDMDAEDKTADA